MHKSGGILAQATVIGAHGIVLANSSTGASVLAIAPPVAITMAVVVGLGITALVIYKIMEN